MRGVSGAAAVLAAIAASIVQYIRTPVPHNGRRLPNLIYFEFHSICYMICSIKPKFDYQLCVTGAAMYYVSTALY